jgi:hypothetical protein
MELQSEGDLPGEQYIDQIMQALANETFDEATARDVHTILVG